MASRSPTDIAFAWWSAIDRGDFDAAAALLDPGAVVDWPLSNERMPTPDSWRLVNEHYPGRWHARVDEVVVQGHTVVTRSIVTNGGICDVAISFFSIAGDRITRLVEYWPETYAAPGWRTRWVVPLNSVSETSR